MKNDKAQPKVCIGALVVAALVAGAHADTVTAVNQAERFRKLFLYAGVYLCLCGYIYAAVYLLENILKNIEI